MDIILRRRISPVLWALLLIALFVLGTWQSVEAITSAIVTMQLHSGIGELTLPRDFAWRAFEYFIVPFIALVYMVSVKHQNWLTTPIIYQHRMETLLTVLIILTILLGLSFGDKSMFGYVFAGSIGILLGLYLKPVWAIFLLLSMGSCFTLLVWWNHGSFNAVSLGLLFQNILLMSFLLGLTVRKYGISLVKYLIGKIPKK